MTPGKLDRTVTITRLSIVAILLGFLSGCQKSSTGPQSSLTIDGSSTVYPIVSEMADEFGKKESNLGIVINKSGTGSGMQKFSRREIDIAAASRPIEKQELTDLKTSHMEAMEIPFAYDGVCVIVNNTNRWAKTMTLRQLQLAWQQQSTVRSWWDLDSRWPKSKISFYGPTDNHGTYDYFVDAMSPNSATLRSDVQTNQEYNAIVEAVADDPNGIGYVGLAYFANNQDKVKAVSIDLGDGPVAPSQDSVADGRYGILSRPLLLYVDKGLYEKKLPVRDFISYALSDQGQQNVAQALYVKLSGEALAAVRARVAKEVTGSAFTQKQSFSLNNLANVERGSSK